jgi:hypothetical protein
MHAAPHVVSLACPSRPCLRSDSDHVTLVQDISAVEQASLNHLRVPELSPSDPISNASSPSSSEPVTPVDPPSHAAHADLLVAGKHQPDPQPYKPISKTTSRGAVWRARQVLFSLGKRKRQPSEDAGTPANVEVQVLDSEEEEESPAETTHPASQVSRPLPRITRSVTRDAHFADFIYPPKCPDWRNSPYPGATSCTCAHPLIQQCAHSLMPTDLTSLHARCLFGATRMTRSPRRPRPELSPRAPPTRANRPLVPHGLLLRSSPPWRASSSSYRGASPLARQSCCSRAR